MASNTIFNSESDEDNWVIEINHLVSKTNLEMLSKIPVCIYYAPKSLSCAKPEAFSPQLIAIGPYNHFQPGLYPMERFKIYSAKKVLSYFKRLDLKELVEQLLKDDTVPYIRACYHKHLDLKDDTLLYTIVIDGLFLLDFCHNFVVDEKASSGNFLKGTEQVAQTSGVSVKDAIIRDVVMLENQIPIYTMMMIMMIETSKPRDSVLEELGSLLLSFCEKHCPLKSSQKPITCFEAATKPYHLLDLIYHLVVSHSHHENSPPPPPPPSCEISQGVCNEPQKTSSKSHQAIVTCFKKLKSPLIWTIGALKRLTNMNIPGLKPIKKFLDAFLQVFSLQPNSSETASSESEAPVVVTTHYVSELYSVGIRFKPSKGGIMTIEFDEIKGVFHLPVIKLDVNSEVIMRNLVAHEALTKPDFLIFTRYTELMRAIIDTVEDVELLKEAKIIESSSTLSVEETEKLFNGMSKSIGPTKTEKLDETIKKVNKYFHDKQRANLVRNIIHHVYSSWKLFTLLATFVLLAMTALQTFCSVYDCPALLWNKTHSSS